MMLPRKENISDLPKGKEEETEQTRSWKEFGARQWSKERRFKQRE